MTLPRWNYSSRNRRIPTEKRPSVEVQHERIHQCLDVIMERGEIHEYDLQRVLGWGPGVFERIVRIVKSYHNEEADFNKKTKVFKHKIVKILDEPTVPLIEISTDWQSEL